MKDLEGFEKLVSSVISTVVDYDTTGTNWAMMIALIDSSLRSARLFGR